MHSSTSSSNSLLPFLYHVLRAHMSGAKISDPKSVIHELALLLETAIVSRWKALHTPRPDEGSSRETLRVMCFGERNGLADFRLFSSLRWNETRRSLEPSVIFPSWPIGRLNGCHRNWSVANPTGGFDPLQACIAKCSMHILDIFSKYR